MLHAYFALLCWSFDTLEHIGLQLVILGFTWTLFDMLINLMNDWYIFYIDEKGVNLFFLKLIGRKLLWILRAVSFIAGGILLLI